MDKNLELIHWPQAHAPKSKTVTGIEWKYEYKKYLKNLESSVFQNSELLRIRKVTPLVTSRARIIKNINISAAKL